MATSSSSAAPPAANGAANGHGSANGNGTPSPTFPRVASSDLDDATPGFDSVSDAVAELRKGNFVVVLDDEDRENEGDLIIPAEHATPEKMAFMNRHTSGIICVALKPERCRELELPLMVPKDQNTECQETAFTVTVDLIAGTSTGISASDRSATIRALGDPGARPGDFRRPGHILPLRYSPGGVLRRSGHTEAAVDLAELANCYPAGALCELVADDGQMMRYRQSFDFAREHGLKVISIADLIRYRRKRSTLIKRGAVARLPTRYGTFAAHSYRSLLDGIEHVAMVYGDVGDGARVLCRVHSECLTGDIFGSVRCDCGPQLDQAMKMVAEEGRGVVVYLRGQEGRGIGLVHKLHAYNLQDEGRDTVEANEDLGLPVDSREYGVGAQILKDIGVHSLRLMTNNPAKFQGLKGHGLAIAERVPIVTEVHKENERYIATKREKMGHFS